MRYILNESDLGVQNLTDELRKKLLEDLGFQIEEQQTETLEEAKTEEPIVEGEEDSLEYTCLFESEGDVYAILEDVYEFEGELFVEAVMLEDEVASLKEGHGDDFADGVAFADVDFVLEGAYEHDDHESRIFVKLTEREVTDAEIDKALGGVDADKPETHNRKPDSAADKAAKERIAAKNKAAMRRRRK